ncbi:acyltransferase [Candidatus Parcubacteria bacterium]|jgi:peptidoglycan/LPS O-acetylase OafA/YrhL|nr:MAG: acyltransferase [Candidatus Parcubacteria bacterium]
MFGIYRFILALNVVFFHLLKVPAIGSFAVYSFFILSGFLMTTIMHNTYGYSINGFKKYVLNRFLRLYPVYWTLLSIIVVIVCIIGSDYASSFLAVILIPSSIEEWLANLLMLYPRIYPGEYPIRLSPATWALTLELFFYLLIGLGISKNKYVTIIWFIVSFVYAAIKIILGDYDLGYGSIMWASLPFSIGSLLFYYQSSIYQLINTLGSAGIFIIIFSFVVNITVGAASTLLMGDAAWKLKFIGAIINLMSSSLMLVLLFNNNFGVSKRKDRFFGDLSYPIYLFHWGGGLLASWILARGEIVNLDQNRYKFAVFLLGFVITVTVSYFVNVYINNKIEKKRLKVKSGIKN